ncbi:MAG TPA: hypothetical protein VLS89_17705 [Candidatus Nanopelagicales bacterium]|nr:hypothetical protein [Candidatus Nanopelagicales bacterium]
MAQLTDQVIQQVLSGRLPPPDTYVRERVFREDFGSLATAGTQYFILEGDLPAREGYLSVGNVGRLSSLYFADVEYAGVTRDFVVFRRQLHVPDTELNISVQGIVDAVKNIRNFDPQSILGLLNGGARWGYQTKEAFPALRVGFVTYVRSTLAITAADPDPSGFRQASVSWTHTVDHVWEWYYLQYRRLEAQYNEFTADPNMVSIANNLHRAPTQRDREHSISVLSAYAWAQVAVHHGWDLLTPPFDPRGSTYPPGGIYADLRAPNG